MRHQLHGERSFALGGFIDTDALMTAVGAKRDATLATVGGSIAYDITPALTISVNGRTEFGAASSMGSGAVLLRLRF